MWRLFTIAISIQENHIYKTQDLLWNSSFNFHRNVNISIAPHDQYHDNSKIYKEYLSNAINELIEKKNRMAEQSYDLVRPCIQCSCDLILLMCLALNVNLIGQTMNVYKVFKSSFVVLLFSSSAMCLEQYILQKRAKYQIQVLAILPTKPRIMNILNLLKSNVMIVRVIAHKF